ncbi:hypothetical protein [Paraburkholderia ginsengisoli]|nr:hypothetical protein [Paraburkholderia ginsengisoli]
MLALHRAVGDAGEDRREAADQRVVAEQLSGVGDGVNRIVLRLNG